MAVDGMNAATVWQVLKCTPLESHRSRCALIGLAITPLLYRSHWSRNNLIFIIFLRRLLHLVYFLLIMEIYWGQTVRLADRLIRTSASCLGADWLGEVLYTGVRSLLEVSAGSCSLRIVPRRQGVFSEREAGESRPLAGQEESSTPAHSLHTAV